MFLRLISIVSIIQLGIFSQAHAATISYFTDQPSWETAVSGNFLTEDFNDGILDLGISVITNAGTIANNQWEDRLTPSGDSTTFSFDPQLIGFGGFWDLAGPGGLGTGIAVTITLFNNLDEVLSQEVDANLAGTFWGFTSDTPFTKVLLQAGSNTGGIAETYVMDDMVYSQTSIDPNAIPIPSTIWLFLAGLFGLRRFQKK